MHVVAEFNPAKLGGVSSFGFAPAAVQAMSAAHTTVNAARKRHISECFPSSDDF
jgi:hypothetical protein